MPALVAVLGSLLAGHRPRYSSRSAPGDPEVAGSPVTAPSLRLLQVPPPAQRGDQDLCSRAALRGRDDGRERPLTDEGLHVSGDTGDHPEPHQRPQTVPLRPRAHGPAAGALLAAGGRGLRATGPCAGAPGPRGALRDHPGQPQLWHHRREALREAAQGGRCGEGREG